MTEVDELARTLESVRSAFATLGVRWAVGGSLASSAHGQPRATNEVDVIAELDEDQVRQLPTLLGPGFYRNADAAVDTVRRHGCFDVIDQRSFLKVDVFSPGPGPLGLDQLDRRRETNPPSDTLVPVLGPPRWAPRAGPPVLGPPRWAPLAGPPALGPEDIVLQKLRGVRLGGEVSWEERFRSAHGGTCSR